MTRDLRQALRLFRLHPAFSLAVVAVMALSIGACTAIFSIANAVLLTPLPYSSPGRLVLIWHTVAQTGAGVVAMSPHDYQIYRDATHSFDSVAGVSMRGYNLATSAEPVRATCARVTANTFPALGVAPQQGRWFTPEEDQYGRNPVVVLSHELWTTRFNSAPDLLGKSVNLDLVPHTVVGIMPASFVFPPAGVQGLEPAACYVPAAFSPMELSLPAFSVVVFASLRPGVTIAQANSDAVAAARRVLESYPPIVQKEINLSARVVSLREQVTGSSKDSLLLFTAAVGFLLLIGCANVANLMLAKLQARQREMAIRNALGASYATLSRQLIVESVVLAILGGAVGVLLAQGILRILIALRPGNVARLELARIDLGALVFTVGCSILAGILFSLAPAVRVKSASIASFLGEGARGASMGGRASRMRSVLVVIETAMAMVLLVGAGLLMRSFLQLRSVSPGFDPANVLTFSVALPAERYPQSLQVSQFVRSVLDKAQGTPGVRYAAAGTSLPIGRTEYTVISRVDAPPSSAGFKVAALQTVTPQYHRSLGIVLQSGRMLQDGDADTGLPVAVINTAMAHRYWPEGNVIGQRMQWVGGGKILTIVGIVGDVHQGGLDGAPSPTLYVPLAQAAAPTRDLIFAIRASSNPVLLAAAVRRIVSMTDPSLPIFGLRSAEDALARSIAPQRFNMFLLASFAISALLLATLGIYAVVAYVVSHSSREFGIRLALGASPSSVLGMVLKRGLAWVGAGLVIGAAAAAALTRFMSTLLFGVGSLDPLTFAAVGVILLAASLLAVAIPARRATRVDPTLLLRQE